MANNELSYEKPMSVNDLALLSLKGTESWLWNLKNLFCAHENWSDGLGTYTSFKSNSALLPGCKLHHMVSNLAHYSHLVATAHKYFGEQTDL